MQDYYDPQTGEIIGGDIGGENNSDPMSNMNTSMKPPQKKKWGLVAGICGAVAVVAVVAAVIVTKLISNPIANIGVAAVNTFKESSQLLKDLNIIDMLLDGNASVQMDMENDYLTMSMTGEYDFSGKHKAVNVKGSFDIDDVGDFEADVTAEIDKNRVAFSLQPAIDDIIVYYYTRDNRGDLIDLLEDEDVDIDEVNAALQRLYELELNSADTYTSVLSDIVNAIVDELKNVEIKKTSKKEDFEVNGKKRSCTGYVMELDEDMLEVINDAARDAVKEELKDIEADSKIMDILEDVCDSAFDVIEDEVIPEVKDIELSVYICDKQIACVRVEIGREMAEVIFHGGDYPTQNVEIVRDGKWYDDETVFELTGETKDKTETMELSVFGETYAELEYKTKSGELLVTCDEEEFELEAVIKRAKSELSVEIDDMEIDGEDTSLELTLTDDGFIKALDGDEFDAGEADEDDFIDLIEDIVDEYEGLLWAVYYY